MRREAAESATGRPPDEQRFVTIGADALGRVPVVVYCGRGADVRLIPARKATRPERRQYEPRPGKTRITIRLDEDLLEWFRQQVHAAGRGNYQTLINDALREFVKGQDGDIEAMLRRVLREELQGRGSSAH